MATAFPRPLFAPVTSAVFPSSRMSAERGARVGDVSSRSMNAVTVARIVFVCPIPVGFAGVLGAPDHVDAAADHPHLQAPDPLDVDRLRLLDPPLLH
jgi:hypothetical protein